MLNNKLKMELKENNNIFIKIRIILYILWKFNFWKVQGGWTFWDINEVQNMNRKIKSGFIEIKKTDIKSIWFYINSLILTFTYIMYFALIYVIFYISITKPNDDMLILNLIFWLFLLCWFICWILKKIYQLSKFRLYEKNNDLFIFKKDNNF